MNARMGDDRETALMFAVIYGLRDCVNFLIKSGADVNLKDKVGNTALICAAIHDEEKCIDLLIEAGADVNTPYFTARTGQTTPLVECIKCGIPLIVSEPSYMR